MTLTDWLHRLERLHYKTIDMGLERVSQVAQRLGLLSGLPFIITIGGTNGKGSTVAFLESILLTHDLRVGTYTSPHLIAFNERVKVDGQNIDDPSLVAAFESIEAVRGDISLTYFEFTTLAAMLVFKRHKLDVILLEVGLGGRLDAVNIWDADIAIVTSIDLDHQQFLGDTREKIGLEKIGIGRPGKPLIMGERNAPALVVESASALGCRLLQVGIAFEGRADTSANGGWTFAGIDRAGQRMAWPGLPATRLYWHNAALALQTLALSPFALDPDRVRQALQAASLTGRQQLVQQNPAVMLDVGHNPHAAAHLAHCLRQAGYGRIHCIVGMLKDKAVADTLAELLDVVDCWHPVTLPGERGLSGQVVEALLQSAGAICAAYSASPQQAYRRLISQASADDLILVFGSFYTVADVIQYRQSVTGKG